MRGSARWPPGAPVQRPDARPEGRPSPFAACPGGAAPAAPLPRPSPSSRGRRWGGPLASAQRPGSRGAAAGRGGGGRGTGFGLNGRPQPWPAERGLSLLRGDVGAVGPSKADLAALGRLSVARWPSLASPAASRGFGARGERHRAAASPPAPSPRLMSLSLSRVPAQSLSVKGSQCRLAESPCRG